MIDKNLLNLLGKNKKYIVYIIIFDILLLVASITTTGLITYIVSRFNTNDQTLIISLFIAALLCIASKILLTNLNGVIITKMSSKILTETRNNLYNSLIKVKSLKESEACQLGVEGLEQLNLYFTVYVPQFVYAMIAPLLLFILFCFINWPTAIMFLVCVSLIPASIIAVSKYAKKIFNKYWDKYLSMGGSFLDAINGIKELKLFKYENQKGEELDNSNEEFRKITMKVLIMQLFSVSIMDLVAYGGAASGIAVSLFQLQSGVISSPYLVLFIILVGSEFFLPMRSLGSAFHLAMNGATAGTKLLAVIKNAEKIDEGKNDISFIKSVKFDRVSFKYSDSNLPVFTNLNITLEKGKLYGIVGQSGSGKSTLAKIISKELPYSGGEIFINNILLRDANTKSYYKHLAYVSYETHIFNDTIFNNFKMAKSDVTKVEIYSSLKKVNLNHLVDKYGYDYVIKEGSINLSGGEKQRLALAINLTTKKDLYIFDEATSNIDKESEEIIIKNIYDLKKDAIVVLISHSFNNIIKADEILFIDNHEFKIDTHVNLTKSSIKYNEIYKTQLDGGMIYEKKLI